MNGVKFGFMHSYDFLELILNSKEIGVPEVKRNEIDIPGADGSVDFTYFFGEPKYENRTLKFDFAIKPEKKDYGFLKHFYVIQGILHGTRRRIILDEDSDYFFDGIISVGGYKYEKGIASFQITCDCDPFRSKVTETVVSQYVADSYTFQLYNGRKRVVPEITTDAMMSFECNGEMLSHGSGTFKLPIIELSEGYTAVNVLGTGNVRFAYSEGRL